ncbi:MAG: RNA-binding cell elongation regulator Jag/EloR [Chloroflexota bacterium]
MEPNQSYEFTGSTVDEAITAGITQLGVGPNDVLVEVLEEPSRGVFGIGARPARVRLKLLRQATPPAAAQPAPQADVDEEDEDYDAYEDDDAYEDTYAGVSGEDVAEDGKVAHQVVSELLEKMDIRGRVTVSQAEPDRDNESPPWVIDIEGPDTNILIGRKGETLAALQYITRLIASRRLQRRANIIVDAGGYKSRRGDRLEQLALRMAEQAVSTGEVVVLEPMPANERRIIHMTLRDRADVETRSSGEGEARKVTIIPVEQ